MKLNIVMDWPLIASGAALVTFLASGVYGAQALLAGTEPHQRRSTARAHRSVDVIEPAPPAMSAVGAAPGPAAAPALSAAQLDGLKQKLSDVQRQKRDLEMQVHGLERELARRPEKAPTERDEFDLAPEDWKELAATGRIKYRVPCVLPNDPSYKIPLEELDRLGLGPDDGKLVAEAQRRSNARIWATLRPLCAKVVGDEHAVELLGAESCLSLLERTASKSDAVGAFKARRAVGEVRAGLRDVPGPAEQGPLYQAYVALTSEGSLFEADLAESFGPEEASYVTQNMRCASTRR
jgi:cell division septum initiation protein DivIVA